MKKFAALALSLLFVVCFAAAGCNKRADNTIVYYMWGSTKEVATAQQLAADFEVLHPGWHVEVEPSSGSYYDNLKTFSAAATNPTYSLWREA